MRFGVIICRKCRRAFGVGSQFKSSRCPFCNTKMTINPGEFKYKCDSEKELELVIAKINQQLLAERTPTSSPSVLDFGENISEFPAEKNRTRSAPEKPDIYEQLDPFKRIAMKYKIKDESIEFLITLTQALYRELGEFSAQEFGELLTTCGLNSEKVHEHLEKLKALDIIYEPKLGKFRLIEE